MPQPPLQPYCAQCGAVRPTGSTATICVPCANRGHTYRLVTDHADRRRRLAAWRAFYTENGYTPRQIGAIAYFQRLLKPPVDPEKELN